jgi:hypothetical protein
MFAFGVEVRAKQVAKLGVMELYSALGYFAFGFGV